MLFSGSVPAAAALPAIAAEATAAGTAPEPLELSINGAHGEVSLVLARPGDVLVPKDDLAAAGVLLPPGIRLVTVNGLSYVSLKSLAPDVSYRVDELALMLVISVPRQDLAGTQVDLSPVKDPPASAVASGFLNYDLATNVANASAGSSSAYQEFGASSNAGVFSSSVDESSLGVTRGLTSFVTEDQSRLHRTTFGDGVADTGALGSSVVIGGVTIERAYELQPRFVEFPSAGISGTVLTPSTADVYVNGAFVKTVTLQPGPFSLSDLQLQTGSNVTTVVLHDAQGQTTTLDQRSYVGADLLRKGLTDYQYSLGFVRPDPFGTVDRYGALSALARYRVGLTNAITAGGHVEAQAGLISGGPRIDLGLPVGTLALYSSLSDARGATGSASALAYTYSASAFSLDVSAAKYSQSYADVQTSTFADRRSSEVDAGVFARLARGVSLELKDANIIDRDDGRLEIFSSDLRLGLGPRTNLDLYADRFSNPTPSWSLGTSLMVQTGKRGFVTASSQGTGSQRQTGLLFDETAPSGPGFGFRLEADTSANGALGYANLDEHTEYGDASASFTTGSGSNAATLAFDGSVTLFQTGIFPGRPLSTSYALADVDGLPHAPIELDGADMGKTNGRGMLVLPNLAPYVPNRIELGNLDAFPDIEDAQSETTVIPRTHAGVIAPLAVHRVRIFNGTVAIARNGATIVPAYGMLTFTRDGTTIRSDIGSRGNFYFENLVAGTYRATIESNEGRCEFEVTVRPSAAMVTNLGALTCAR